MLCLLAACSRTDTLPDMGQDAADSIGGIPAEEVISGMVRVKLSAEPEDAVGLRSVSGQTVTGIPALDDAAGALGITRVERTFPYNERFEERTRREGLHLWYNVWFDGNMAATRAVNALEGEEGIAVVAPVRKIGTRAAAWNDPYYAYQWNFSNPGTESWQLPEADIRVADVWSQYNGDPAIIVAVVDEGIDIEHPDLAENIWVNTDEIARNGVDDDGNGYVDDVNGYNFYSYTPTIIPYDHGTHVAGIIAAANNNGEGVCGIAGGDGSAGSGVRIMCCQIIGSSYSNRGAEAIKYAADNGAVICQNSWGYTGTIDPADKEAIDYFIKYAGCDNNGNQLDSSPMKGGIVLFATNNHNSSSPSDATPADYDKVIGVAALGPDFRKASYSDYGEYIDLCAPGGERPLLFGDDERVQILSTTGQHDYGYLYGASMACPHVAGVAALLVEKHGVGKRGFTAAQLEDLLLRSARSVDDRNPDYAGQLGMGCVDASAALAAGLDAAGEAPFQLLANPVTNGMLTFRVTPQAAGEATLTVRNSIGNVVLRTALETRKYMSKSVDISRLSAGYYVLEYSCNGQTWTKRFVKY